MAASKKSVRASVAASNKATHSGARAKIYAAADAVRANLAKGGAGLSQAGKRQAINKAMKTVSKGAVGASAAHMTRRALGAAISGVNRASAFKAAATKRGAAAARSSASSSSSGSGGGGGGGGGGSRHEAALKAWATRRSQGWSRKKSA